MPAETASHIGIACLAVRPAIGEAVEPLAIRNASAGLGGGFIHDRPSSINGDVFAIDGVLLLNEKRYCF